MPLDEILHTLRKMLSYTIMNSNQSTEKVCTTIPLKVLFGQLVLLTIAVFSCNHLHSVGARADRIVSCPFYSSDILYGLLVWRDVSMIVVVLVMLHIHTCPH